MTTVHDAPADLFDELAAGDPRATPVDPAPGTQPEPADPDSSATGLEPIAVVGMAARVPGADGVDEFWRNLLAGKESRTTFTLEQQRALGVDPADVDDEEFVPVAFVLEHHDEVDAALFGMTPREASMADPGQRLMLELAHTALGHAGIDPARFDGDIGVYSGGGNSGYLWMNVRANAAVLAGSGQLGAAIGNGADYLSTNISYKLGLTGPSLSVNTACSTSLVAVHLACEALRSFECDAAIAGGVSIELPHGGGYVSEHDFTSPEGHVRAFDAGAAGTVWGSGGGAVVLRRLSDALRDGDTVHAVVLGNAINNDGATKVGFSAPSVVGQVAVIRQALQVAGVSPRTIGYVEAHGTGTSLGDPIEVQSLTRAYAEELSDEQQTGDGSDEGGENQWCAIGSVKSNLGHLSQAAGVISLIKAALVVRSGQVPPTLHFERPNPAIDFGSSPFYPAATVGAFPELPGPRRAAVSSFGIGGTNAHVVLEQPPAARPAPAAPSELVALPLSAHTDTALARSATALADHLETHPEQALTDVARTLRTGRTGYRQRAVVLAADRTAAIAALRGTLPRGASEPAPLGLLFSGQGSQHPGMGAGLYRRSTVFAEAVDECAELLLPELGLDLRDLLLATPADHDEQQLAEIARQLTDTRITQPALFTVEHALARFWTDAGARPAVVVGHSIGEYAAAVVAGVLTLPAAASLVATRGRLMGSMPAGVMLAVQLPAEQVRPLLTDGVEIAVVNGPRSTVVGGASEAVAAFAATLPSQVGHTLLRTSHAFHTASMEPVLAEFADAVAAAGPRPPVLDMVSTVTAELLTAEQAVDPGYWAQQLRRPVLFGDAVATLLRRGPVQLLECGPGRQLAGLARMQTGRGAAPLHSLPGAGDQDADVDVITRSWARLWADGADLELTVAAPGHRVPLPAYPYERRRHWVDPTPGMVPGMPWLGGAPTGVPGSPTGPVAAATADPSPVIEDWFAVPTCTELPPAQRTDRTPTVLVLPVAGAAGGADEGRGAALDAFVDALRDAAVPVSVLPDASPGTVLAALAPLTGPVELLHPQLPGTGTGDPTDTSAFRTLLQLLQGLAATPRDDLALTVVTGPVAAVTGEEEVRPEQALVAGPVRVGALELPWLRTRWIDVDGATSAAGLVEELLARDAPAEVSLRRDRRWTTGFRQAPPTARRAVDRTGMHCLVTGGTGGIGTTVARDLALRHRARLTLLARSPLPPREQWSAPGAAADPLDRTARTVAAVREMEAAGAQVQVVAVDVTDATALRSVVEDAVTRWGALDLVVHAAGVPGGGMLEVKDPEVAAAVLAPKVAGTAALRAALQGIEVRSVVLCSSITALAGDVGQVDYCSGNAYLDASARTPWGAPVVSVNWGGWSGVGMAVETVSVPGGALAAGAASAEPTRDEPARDEPARDEPAGDAGPATGTGTTGTLLHGLLTRYDAGGAEGEISPATHWVLDEHRIGGIPVLPGTAMIESVLAAHRACHPGGGATVIRDLAFLAPFRVAEGTTATLRVAFGPLSDGERAVTVERVVDGVRTVHAQAVVADAPQDGGAPRVDLDAVMATVIEKDADRSGLYRGQTRTSVVTFGPRWDVLQRHHRGPGLEVAELGAVAGTPGEWICQPALLDVATAFSERGEGSYLPIGYGEITVHAALPETFRSVLRYSGGVGEVIAADLELVADDGSLLVGISEFSLRRIDPAAVTAPDQQVAPDVAPPDDGAPHRVTGPVSVRMAPPDGATAFRLLLASGRTGQVAITPQPVAPLLDRIRTAGRDVTDDPADGRDVTAPAAAAVGSGTGGTAARIAAVWSAVLGVPDVAPDDDFFALGGNSLVAVQLIGQIRKAVGVRLPMRVIFDAPTVQEMADQVDALRTAAATPDAAPAETSAGSGTPEGADAPAGPPDDEAPAPGGPSEIPRIHRPGR